MLAVTVATTALSGLQPAVAIEDNLETVEFVEPERQPFGANDDGNAAMAYIPIDPTESPRVLENTGGLTEQQVAELQQEAQSWPETPSYPATAEEVVERQAATGTERSGRFPGIQEQTTDLHSMDKLLRAANTAPRCRRFAPHNIEVCGAILDRYEQVGGPASPFLWPVEPMSLNPDGRGYRLALANGFIYWSPETGAHIVPTQVFDVWKHLDWEKGVLGYPITDQDGLSSNPLERMQKFQHGAIVQNAVGLNAAVYGRIYTRWIEAGGVNGRLGYPITNEFNSKSGRGRMNIFDRGVIVWSLPTDAHIVADFPLTEWISTGFEDGKYGFPIGEPYEDGIGEAQKFERGTASIATADFDTTLVEVDGKKVYRGFLVYENNMEKLTTLFMGGSSRSAKAVPPKKTPSDVFTSSISIPNHYEWYGDDSEDALHDFCTSSPDMPRVRQDNIYFNHDRLDYRGACAIHDLCYEASDRNSADISALQKRVDCDDHFYSNLKTIANEFSREPGVLPAHKFTAYQLAWVYHTGIVLKHKKQDNWEYNSPVRPITSIKPPSWRPDPDHWYYRNYSAKTYPW